MKNRILTGMLIFSLGITACSDWLNVEPKTTVKEKELFSRESVSGSIRKKEMKKRK